MTPSLADLAGLWRRVWLRAGNVDDRTTAVSWFQGPEIFVDLRIPADLPDYTGALALAELDAMALTALARCDGFAGTTAVAGGICTWTRTINWHGPQAGADVGALCCTADGLLETGVHADYAELWSREGPAFAAARALTDDSARRGFVVWNDAAFSFCRGRAQPAAEPLADRLRDALEAGDRAALAAVFETEICVGAFEGDDAVILASTNPCRIGAPAFSRKDLRSGQIRIAEQSFGGEHREVAWSVPPSA